MISVLTMLIFLIFVIFMMFFGTALFALRGFSLGQLESRHEGRAKGDRLERLSDLRVSLALTSAIFEAVCVAMVFVCVVRLFRVRGTGAEFWAEGAVFGVCFGLFLVFGLAIPFLTAQYAGERFLSRTLGLLRVVSIPLSPLVWVLSLCDPLVRRVAGSRENGEENAEEQADQEILSVVTETEKQGLMDAHEKHMIESVIEFHNNNTEAIMTPRTDMVGVPVDATVDAIKGLVRTAGHSRFPVYEETIDRILGVLNVKDLLLLDPAGAFDVKKIMRKVVFVPESKPLDELLRYFQEKKVQFAIVLDEYGGTAGLVTIEDVVEELVGEIADEYDPERPEPIQRIDDDTVEVEARVHVEELNEALDVDIPKSEEYETMGGLVFATLGKIPRVGEEFDHKNLHIRVLDAEERRVTRLSVHVNRNDKASS